MEMNDPLRREEKKEPGPDQDKSGPGSPDSSRPGRDNPVSYTHLTLPTKA